MAAVVWGISGASQADYSVAKVLALDQNKNDKYCDQAGHGQGAE
jgi:hypothetical protein